MNKKKKFQTDFLFALPYAIIFFTFVILLIMISIFLSFTYYDTINAPRWVGLSNYVTLFTRDSDFMQYALPNTVKYAIIVGPIGYLFSYLCK